MLREQKYLGPEDDQEHFNQILPAFRDERYFRVDDKPVFYIHRPQLLPNAPEFIDRWQAMARAAGLPGLYLVAEVVDVFGEGMQYTSLVADGFDAGVYLRYPVVRNWRSRLQARIARKLGEPARFPYSTDPDTWKPVREHSYLQPLVHPNWDNTPRTGAGGRVLTGATPERFEQNVRTAVSTLTNRPAGEQLLWIKSWNEWAEGNYLEPDLEWGRGWLEALRNGISSPNK